MNNYLFNKFRSMSWVTLVKLIIVGFVIGGLVYIRRDVMNPDHVRAFAHLVVDMGVPSGEPIFTVENMLPGDCETREISIENTSDAETMLSIKSKNVFNNDNLGSVMDMEIREEDLGVVYFNKLNQFFSDSESLDGTPLFPLPGGETMTYEIKICFDHEAENEFQNTQVIFDLVFGEVISPIELPSECSHLAGDILFVIEGTEGDDEMDGSTVGELILGFGGNDDIDGDGGNDCIVGGDGDDDTLDGGTGNDVIIGGPGHDTMDGGSNDDTMYGNEGNDVIDGESGNDTIYGGSGNDEIDASSGEDRVYGEEGDDEIFGKAGDDLLDGGDDSDFLDGGTGTDTCVNGELVDDCEG